MSFVDKIILPGGGRRYSGTNSKGLIWLRSKSGNYFPNHMIRKTTKSIILYCHGNGGSLGDFKSIVSFYSQWYDCSQIARSNTILSLFFTLSPIFVTQTLHTF